MNRIIGSVLVRNEDIYLERALLNILDFCDEILVADHHSTDQTSAILARLAAQHPKIIVHRVDHPGVSNDHLAPYAGTESWIFGVDGDEIYDPVGLQRMREELLSGKYDEWWIVFGNVLHCTSLDPASGRAVGHLSPPSKSMTKLFNFRLLKAVDPEAHHRLVGENKVFFDPKSVEKRLSLHDLHPWEEAWFRCLHTCFMPRSTLDQGNAAARQNVSESFDWVKQWKDRLRRWLGIAPARNYKHEKYRRGDAVTLDVAQFFPPIPTPAPSPANPLS
jgi:glycosyltransferase involved in cell wall biosynthesis